MSEPALGFRVVGVVYDAADPSRGVAVTVSTETGLIELTCPLSAHRVTYLGLTRSEATALQGLLQRAVEDTGGLQGGA